MIMIRDYRKRAGMTMKELGDRVGCSEAAISLYELGKREASYEMLLKISEVLGTDVNHLLGHEEPVEEDISEFLEELRTRPELRILFQTSKDMTPEQINSVVQMIEGFKK